MDGSALRFPLLSTMQTVNIKRNAKQVVGIIYPSNVFNLYLSVVAIHGRSLCSQV
jgi:hypothetical protein